MPRTLYILLALLLVACVACDKNRVAPTAGDGSAAGMKKAPGFDPMLFVLHYERQFEDIISQHAGDCEGALAELLRFVADHEREFLGRIDENDAGTPTEAGGGPVGPLMDFAAACPQQVSRLNRALHELVK